MFSRYCFNILNSRTLNHRFNCCRKIIPLNGIFSNNVGYRNITSSFCWKNSFLKPELTSLVKVGVQRYTTKIEGEESKRSGRHQNKWDISKLSSNSKENVAQNDYLTNITQQNKGLQIYYADTEENKQTLKLYPSPKHVLNNIFTLLVQETKNKSLQLTPSFKPLPEKRGGNTWICTYNIAWPTEIKFLAKDNKKKVASDKAALAALTWLRLNNKITTSGSPIIYDKEEVRQLTKGSIPCINLQQRTIETIDKIISTYEEKMNPYVLKCQDSSVVQTKNVSGVAQEHALNINKVMKKFLGFQKYTAKEKNSLPISAYKEQFIELLNTHQVVIVKGEPGCGKSTRIPQYVLEAWVREHGLSGKTGMIAVTQPRRIAAISLAERVCSERNESVGHIVGYQVRLNSTFHQLTGRILYCTTGILLRHVQSDSSLSEFSHIILDEAHERDVNTDLLMNVLKISLKKNPNLKLIVMSATIDTNMFKDYYSGAPVIDIPGFTYPVDRFFIDTLDKLDLSKTKSMCEGLAPTVVHEDVVTVIDTINCTKPEGAILCFLPGWDDIAKIQRMIPQRGDTVVYCLHSRLNDREQFKIFSKPPPGVRKIILATNIAETSVTIDDVVYVIDTGVHKEQRFDTDKGIKCVDNNWISKASAIQRSGRAGRVQPGQCYHLYTQSKHDSFEEYTLPEILRTSLTKIVLDSKAFSNNMDTLTFMNSLPTPPEETSVSKAIEELKELELLDEHENLTTLGRTLAEFQLEPKLAKTLVNSHIYKCLSPIIDIITLFSTDTEVFSSGLINKETIKEIKSQFSQDSDHLAMMRIFERFLEFDEFVDANKLKGFCRDLNLIPHKMEMFRKLRKIHSDYLVNGLHDVLPFSDEHSDNDEFVKAVLYSGVGNVLQHRTWDIVKNRLKNNTNVLLTRNNHKATITPESVNYRRYKFPSNYLLYINETRSNIRRTTLVRESSFLTNLAVLLFSNKNLKIDKVCDIGVKDNVENVELVLENTNIRFMCEKKQAEKIIKCKEVIKLCYGYFIAQLTRIGERKEDVNIIWSDLLELITDVIKDNTK